MLIVSCSKYLEDVKVIDSNNCNEDNDVKAIDSTSCMEDTVDIFTNMMTAYLESWLMENRSYCLDLFDSINCKDDNVGHIYQYDDRLFGMLMDGRKKLLP